MRTRMNLTKTFPAKSRFEILLAGSVAGIFLISLVYWACAFHHGLPAMTDTLMHAYPDKIFNRGQFRQGILPLWNSMIGCGIPQVANWQSACFYPLTRIFDAFDVSQTFMPLAFLHQALAFAGGFLWLRSRGLSPLGSSLGAFCFSGSALFVRSWAVPHPQAALTWIPWIFWSSSLALKKQGPLPWGLPAIFLALQILAGYPLFVFYTLFLLAVWMILQKPSLKTAVWMFLALLTALCATALQWIPFLDFLPYSHRGGWWKEFPFFNKPAEYLSLIKPDFLGTPGDSRYQGTPANYFFNLYFGLVPLGVVVLDWFLTGAKKTFFSFWNLSAVGFLLWMAGTNFPVLRIFPEKFLELLEPSKSAPLFVFCASTAAAMAVHRWFSAPQKFFPVLTLLLTLSWTLNLLWIPFHLALPLPNPYGMEKNIQTAEQIRNLAGPGRILSLSLENQLTFRGDDAIVRAMKSPVENILVDTNEAWGIRSTSLYLSIFPKSVNNLSRYAYRGFPYRGDLLDIAGVRLFLLPQPLFPPKYREVGKLGENFIFLNNRAAGDLRWVPESETLPDSVSILERISRPGSGWEKKVYLEKNTGGMPEILWRASRPPAARGNVRNSCRISDTLDCPSPGYAVFNETCAPGWRAWVDGKPKPIQRAYGLFMSVETAEKGRHQLDFRYEPVSFRLGLFLSCLSLALLAGLGPVVYFRTRV